MTDREMLEAAAKAAGMDYWHPMGVLSNPEFNERFAWNPLTDDGDALRLAVALRLDIVRPYADYHSVCVWMDHERDYLEEPLGSDPCAATRRAIVRAAAAIGRTM